MRIIKEGVIKIFQKTCPECGCIFEFTRKELIKDYDLKFLFCPCCNYRIEWLRNEEIK